MACSHPIPGNLSPKQNPQLSPTQLPAPILSFLHGLRAFAQDKWLKCNYVKTHFKSATEHLSYLAKIKHYCKGSQHLHKIIIGIRKARFS